ncbi:gamma-glutamyltransferase [Salinicoccus hispanicus]|uniref:Glutathione hydrolase proenzyme n=1 Tax=Salinicoccus hispanicus TaxID=157225 RepID=A0A6N8TXG0_9STAP|nr:gamma-glutamyltransferase [Salinicoccus hispanicus]MXQ50638.1 gamma-glutamyltransferase [Salinicoccus hispanicus]
MTNIEDIFEVQKQHYSTENQIEGDEGSYGMVASAIEEATHAGNQMLEQGGNAFDALIAVQLALAAVEGMNTGIGAGGFIVCYDSEDQETKVINAHSRSPAELEPEHFLDENGEVIPFDVRSTHGTSIGVPGIMKGLLHLHENYATLPLATLIDPAIRLAESDFRVNSLWERTLELFSHRLGEEARKKFMPDGKLLKEGDTIVQPELANTLKIIRDEGFDSVYEGRIADAIVDAVKEQDGVMTHQDLINYHVKIEEPLWSSYKGFDIAMPPPPSGGGIAVAQQLKILEELNISQYDPHSPEKYHLLAQTMQLALADKNTHIGDSDFHELPIGGLLHPEYINERRAQISTEDRAQTYMHGDPWKYQEGRDGVSEVDRYVDNEGFETTHFTAVDQWGNVASCTSSIERIYGSGIMVPGYGFIMNNDLTDFEAEPDQVNEPNGHKYPTSSKCPTILFHEGRPFFTLGSPGAQTIVASVVQTIINIIDYNMSLNEAISEPRVYVTRDLETQWQDGLEDDVLEALKKMGYHFDQSFKEQTADTRIGDVQAIMIDHSDNHKLYGAADSPRPGGAEGI